MPKVASLLTASIYPDKILGFFDNVQKTASDMNAFEVLVKVDTDDTNMISLMEREKAIRPFCLKYIATPKLHGYWSMHTALQDMREICDPESYFVWVTNDEIRFATHGWDTVLKRNMKLFPDEAYYLRTSDTRNLVCSLLACFPRGEHLGFFTKKWLELVEGFERGCSDTGNELLNYHLRTICNRQRSIVINDISYENIEATVSASEGLTEKEWQKKLLGIHELYAKLLKIDTQQNILRRAQRVNAHIWAFENNLTNVTLFDDIDGKKIIVMPQDSSAQKWQSFSYQVSFFTWLKNILLSIKETPGEFHFWIPAIANLLYMRRRFAEQLISKAHKEQDPAARNDIKKSAGTLISFMKELYGGVNLDECEISVNMKYTLRSLVEYLSEAHYQTPENIFINDLKAAAKSLATTPSIEYYQLALELFGETL